MFTLLAALLRRGHHSRPGPRSLKLHPDSPTAVRAVARHGEASRLLRVERVDGRPGRGARHLAAR